MRNALSSLFSTGDEQLMWRVKLQNDAQAFASLVGRWQTPIQRLCARMTGDPHRAEDLTQAAFARVFEHRGDWEPAARFSTFLWRIALNLCHDELRKVKRRGECSLEVLQQEGASGPEFADDKEAVPDAQAQAREQGELVREALAKLPSHYREVVVLRHYERLKFHEIAAVLGIPEGTAKSRMAEALSQLNRLLKHLNEDTICNPQIKKTELRAP
jgi:RNA polymerase sigma-70 factor (ECF subfamily)